MARDIIAYSPGSNLYIIIPCSLSIFMNVIFCFLLIFKICSNKEKNKMSSLEKILLPLSILEGAISILWVLSGTLFKTENELDNHHLGCEILGAFQTFCYIFDWLLVYYVFSHLKNIILNPLNYILKKKKKIRRYLLLSGGISLIFSIACYFLNAFGKSPMLTCFLSIKYDYQKSVISIAQNVLIAFIICVIPVLNLIFGIGNIILVCTNDSYQNDKENRKIFKDNIIHLFIYLFLTLFIPSLYFLEYFKKESIKDNTQLQNYFFASCLIICINPLIVCIIRLHKSKLIKSICRGIKSCLSNNENDNDNLDRDSPLLENDSSFEEFETSAIKKFVMNIYIALCYCLEKQLAKIDVNFDDLRESMNNEANRYKIFKKDIINDLKRGNLINDALIKKREEFSITCVEYAPTIFKYLRQLDGIKEDIIVKSMLPMNNQAGISKTEGRGGSFFINSDDHEFILKTITFEELELIRKKFLFKMVNYFHGNNDSIIGRIYGIYKISMHTGVFKESEIYFILMRNVIGCFFDNLICKYDLKGSSLNRRVDIKNVNTKVMKDVDFNEAEQIFLLSKKDSEKLLDIVQRDANFFCSSGIMDYSLLVVKVSLSKEEINYLFGKDHRKKTEIEFCSMAGIERIPSFQPKDVNIIELATKEDDEKIKKEEENKEEKKEEMKEEIKVEIKEEKKEEMKEEIKIGIDEEIKIGINEEIKEKKEHKNITFTDSKIDSLRKYFFPSLQGDILYIISIIDFFQLYNLQKNLETKYKQLTARVNAKCISSVPPDIYKKRFIEFVKEKTNIEKYIKGMYDPENKNDF